MATFKVINTAGDYRTSDAVKNVINYVTRPTKAKEDGIFGGAVIPKIAVLSMDTVGKVFYQETGPHLRHSILSFAPEEGLSPSDVKKIARKAIRYYEDTFQVLAAVHEDKPHLHIHFVMNTVSYLDGTKYRGVKKDYYDFLEYLNRITAPYHVSVKAEK